MKTFFYFILTIVFLIGCALTITYLSPSTNIISSLNSETISLNVMNSTQTIKINPFTAGILCILIACTIASLYLLVVSLVLKSGVNIYHRLRAGLLGTILAIALFLRLIGILKFNQISSLFIFIILIFIYILSEIIIFEFRTR